MPQSRMRLLAILAALAMVIAAWASLVGGHVTVTPPMSLGDVGALDAIR